MIPEIEKEVNNGKNFALLRQITYAWALATWFKRNLKQSFLNRVYVDQKKITGLDIEDKKIKDKIYNQYLKALKKGVCDYVKIEYDQYTHKNIPRKYFSGGLTFSSSSVIVSNLEKVRNQFSDFAMGQKEQFNQFRARMNRWAKNTRISIASIKMKIAGSLMPSNPKSIIAKVLAGMFVALSIGPSQASNVNIDKKVANIIAGGQNSTEISYEEWAKEVRKGVASFDERNNIEKSENSDEKKPGSRNSYEGFSEGQREIIFEMAPYSEIINGVLGEYGFVMDIKSFEDQKSVGIRSEAVEFMIHPEGKSETFATIVVQRAHKPGDNTKKKRLFLKLFNSDEDKVYFAGKTRFVKANRHSTAHSQGIHMDDASKKKTREFLKNFFVRGLFLLKPSGNLEVDNLLRKNQQFYRNRYKLFLGNDDRGKNLPITIIGDTIIFSGDKINFDTVGFKPDPISYKVEQQEVHIAISVDWTGSIKKHMALAQRLSLIQLAKDFIDQVIDVYITIAVVGKNDVRLPVEMTPQQLLDFLNGEGEFKKIKENPWEGKRFLAEQGYGNTELIEKIDYLVENQPFGAIIYVAGDFFQDYAVEGEEQLSEDEINEWKNSKGENMKDVFDKSRKKGQKIFFYDVDPAVAPLQGIINNYNEGKENPNIFVQTSSYDFSENIATSMEKAVSIKVPGIAELKNLKLSLFGQDTISFNADGTPVNPEIDLNELLQKAENIKDGGVVYMDGYNQVLLPFMGPGTAYIVPKEQKTPY